MSLRSSAIASLGFFTVLAAGMARGEPAAGAKEGPVRTDRFGDPLPSEARARLGTTRLRHRDTGGLAVSPDGKLLVTSGRIEGANLRLWDLATGRLLRQVSGPRCADRIAFSPDGKDLAVATSGEGLFFYRIPTGVLRQFRRNDDGAETLAFAPDGRTLASYSGDNIDLWDVPSGRFRWRIPGGGELGAGLAFSPDSALLAAELSRVVGLWDVARKGRVRQLEGSLNVSCLAFTPDGKHLAGAGWRDVVLWEVATGKHVRSFKGHTESVASLAISPNGKVLATGEGTRRSNSGSDLSIWLWDIATGRPLHVLPAGRETVFDLAFTPDGKTLVSGSKIVRLWDVASGKRRLDFASHEYAVAGVSFLPQGAVRTVSLDHTCRTWESETGREVRRLQLPSPYPRLIALSAEGQHIACADRDGVIRILAADSGRCVRRWPAEDATAISALSLSPDGSLLVVRASHHLSLYRVATGQRVHVWHDQGARDCGCPVFSPDGRAMAWANGLPEQKADDEEVVVHDTADGTLLCRIRLDRPASALAFSPDSRTLVIGEASARRVRGWEVASGKPRWLLTPPEKKEDDLEEGPMHLRFAPDGRRLALGSGMTVQLWDTIAARRLHLLAGHQDHLTDLAFSADGRRLASASWDSSVVIWDTPAAEEDRQPVRPLGDATLRSLWSDLGGADAERAFRAIRALAAQPRLALPFLRTRLRPAAASVDPEHVSRLIADLESDRFDVREKAQQELEQLGALAGAALRRALESHPLLETRRRLERLLTKLNRGILSAEELRQVRLVEVLEQVGGTEARALLKTLAAGGPQARLTREAKASLQRLRGQAKPTPQPGVEIETGGSGK